MNSSILCKITICFTLPCTKNKVHIITVLMKGTHPYKVRMRKVELELDRNTKQTDVAYMQYREVHIKVCQNVKIGLGFSDALP